MPASPDEDEAALSFSGILASASKGGELDGKGGESPALPKFTPGGLAHLNRFGLTASRAERRPHRVDVTLPGGGTLRLPGSCGFSDAARNYMVAELVEFVRTNCCGGSVPRANDLAVRHGTDPGILDSPPAGLGERTAPEDPHGVAEVRSRCRLPNVGRRQDGPNDEEREDSDQGSQGASNEQVVGEA
jgi:hypothetical protein